MMNFRNQKGSAIVIICIIAVVVLIGGLGYVAWNSFFAPKDNTVSQTTAPEQAETNTREADTNKGYVVLEAWNIKFAIADSLKSTEAKYYARTTDDSPAQVYYAFTTSRIQDLGGKCTEEAFGDTVILYRYKEKPIATPDGELINETALDGYYYVLTSPIASCSGFDENGQMKDQSQIEANDRAALKESIRKLVVLE